MNDMKMNNYSNKIIQSDLKKIKDSGLEYEKFNKKTFCITGGTGMLASYIIFFLIYLNENIKDFECNVILLIRNEKKCFEKYGKYLEKEYFKVYKCDICEEINIPDKIDYIIHAASIASTELFIKNPIETILPNSLGTYRLLELAEKNKVDKFLFFSTNVCGRINNIEELTEENVGLVNHLDMCNSYIEAKKFGETLCKAYFNQKNVNVNIARIFHVYGPSVDLESDHRVFAEFANNVIHNQDIIMKSDGSQVRDFCYISDSTEAFLRILLYGQTGEVYNVCNPVEKKSILEIAQMLKEIYKDKGIEVI